MKRALILSILFVLSLATSSVCAQSMPAVKLGDDPAHTIAGRDLPKDDARVTQAREWLKKIAEATGENEEQVAASAMKLSRFFHDALRVRALPIEALEGMALLAAPGKSLGELTSGYYEARRNAADKSHAAARAALKQRQ